MIAGLLSIIAALIAYVFVDFKNSVKRILTSLESTVESIKTLLIDHEDRIKKLEDGEKS